MVSVNTPTSPSLIQAIRTFLGPLVIATVLAHMVRADKTLQHWNWVMLGSNSEDIFNLVSFAYTQSNNENSAHLTDSSLASAWFAWETAATLDCTLLATLRPSSAYPAPLIPALSPGLYCCPASAPRLDVLPLAPTAHHNYVINVWQRKSKKRIIKSSVWNGDINTVLKAYSGAVWCSG